MSSEIDLIADAVAAALNTKLAAWGHPSVVAQRRNVPEWKSSELHGLHVTVIAVEPRQTRITRRRVRFDYDVNIDVRRATKNVPARDAVVATVVDRVGELFEIPAMRRLSAYPAAACTGVQRAGYDPDELKEAGIYAVGTIVTYTVVRAPQ